MPQISLSRGYEALIDDIDFERLSKLRSTVQFQNKTLRYAVTLAEDGKRVPMHRLIMGVPKGDRTVVVHHVNGDGLDNRRSNLRLVDRSTHSQAHYLERPMPRHKNLTTVSLSPETAALFEEAAKYYRFETMASFFRLCGETLAEHYARGDQLVAPFSFVTVCKSTPTK